MKDWIQHWNTPKYQRIKQREIAAVVQHLGAHRPRAVLEVGAGLAQDSREMQHQWNCECVLLDVEREPRDQRRRHKSYGEVSNMQAYHTLGQLTDTLDRMHPDFRYTMLDGRHLPRGTWSFDLIYSNRSWGFHYPVTTYRDWILEHSHAGTVMIAQLRRGITHKGIRIQHHIWSDSKSHIAQFVWA
jgi:hypothetical protein